MTLIPSDGGAGNIAGMLALLELSLEFVCVV